MTPSSPLSNRERAQQGQHSTLVGIATNLALVLGKGAAGILGHSYALIADAIESGTDVVSSGFVWLGLRTAARDPDEDHPYGHGKAEPLAAIAVSFFLLVAAAYIAWHSIAFIRTPHALPAPFTLFVLGGVILVKETLFRYVDRVGKAMDSGAVKADAWHQRSDVITSGAAFIGIGIALWGGKGYESADDWAALVASAVILFNAYHIFRPAFGEIMDEVPNGDWPQQIKQLARVVPGVVRTEKCYVRKMGLGFFVDLHLVVDGELTVRQGHAIAHAVKTAIIEQKPAVYDVLVHVEPN